MNAVCRDVRNFLRDLARELPDIFPAPPFWADVKSKRAGRMRLSRCYYPDNASRKAAKDIIRARVKYWGAALNLEYGRVFIKDQRTLWGSCSGKRNLNFNWRLAAAPPEVLDYVIVHELCHLREMNHSKRFWSLVSGFYPDYKMRRKWLKDNSLLLRSKSLEVAFN